MQAWRRAFPETEARFVCVCVDGRPEATAREFQRLYFDRDMVNAFIDSRDDFPRFQTQLGCQGLVVVDAEGRFATRRSPAFLDHRNAAFEVVENALHALAMRARATDGAEFQTDSRTARDGAARGADDCTNDEKKRIARFATNACGETAADLDDETGFAFAKLPTVEHPDMDSEHADIERLMRLALDTRAARDVRNLTEVFRKHAAAEEALLRDAEDAASSTASGGAVGEVQSTPYSFRASSSHAADHERVIAELHAVVSSLGAETHVTTRSRGMTVFSEKKVDRGILERACRAIVEHAVTYDAAYKGKLACA